MTMWWYFDERYLPKLASWRQKKTARFFCLAGRSARFHAGLPGIESHLGRVLDLYYVWFLQHHIKTSSYLFISPPPLFQRVWLFCSCSFWWQTVPSAFIRLGDGCDHTKTHAFICLLFCKCLAKEPELAPYGIFVTLTAIHSTPRN